MGADGKRRSLRALKAVGPLLVVGAFAVYAFLHTAVRGELADRLGISSRGCYLCAPDVAGFAADDAAAALVFLAVVVAAAASVVARFPGPRYERPLVFGVALATLVVVPSAALGGIASATGGAYLRPPAGPLVAAIPSIVIVVWALSRGWRPSRPRLAIRLDTPLLRWVFGSAAVLVVVAAAVSLLHPPAQGDALSYHAPLGVWFWRDGNLTAMLDRAPGTWAFAHPGTAELWAGLLRLAGGERAADLAQLATALLGATAVAAFTRRTGLRTGAAVLAGCAFLLMPMVALQIGTQANDVTGAAFLIAAIALAAAPRSEWDAWRSTFVGLALGLAVTTKLAVLPSVAVVVVYAVVQIVRRSHPERTNRAVVVAVGGLVMGLVVVGAPWWIRNIARESNPVYPQSLPVIGHGVNVGALGAYDSEYVPRAAAWPLYPLVEPIDDRSGWGPMIALALVPGLALVALRARRRAIFPVVCAFVVTLPFWWRFTLHEPRFFLAHVGLAAVCVPWALLVFPSRRRAIGEVVLAVAAVLSVVLAVDQQLGPLAGQPADRAAFYERVAAVDAFASQLPEEDGILQVTGYGPPRVDYASVYPLLGADQSRALVPLDADEIDGSGDVVAGRMREHGLKYAYVEAAPGREAEVERVMAAARLQLAHRSEVGVSGQIGARRQLFGPVEGGGNADDIVTRFVYETSSTS